MAQYINTNISSLNAQRNLNKSQAAGMQAMQRLSSGLRINSAKDDSAGLAISDRMSSQIKGMTQATRNANDGISLAQTAEGALGEITNNLQRLRELSVQSANATNTTSDRASIQQEADQLLKEIDRVAGQTEFNGTKLLDGSFKNQNFQIGANSGQQISVTMNSATTQTLGTGDASALTARASGVIAGGGTTPAMVAGDVNINGVAIGASAASSDNSSFAAAAGSAIAKAAAFNAATNKTGVTATINATTVEGTSMTGAAKDGVIDINGVQTSTVYTTSDTAATRKAVVSAINAISDRTGVTATDSGTDSGGVSLTAADGRNISVGFDAAGGTNNNLSSATTGLNASATAITAATTNTDAGYNTFFGTYTLSSSSDIKVDQGTGTIANAGLQAGTYAPQQAYTSSKALTTNSTFSAGDFKINGVLIGQSLAIDDKASSTLQSSSAISKAAAINAISGQTGVAAKVNTTTANGQANGGGAGSGTVKINGVTTASIALSATDFAANRAATVAAINAVSGQTGVTAINTNDDTKGVQLEAADGRNIDIAAGTGTIADMGLKAAGTTTGSVTLSSSKAFTIASGTTGTDVTTSLGLEVGTYGGGKSGQSLGSIDLSTAAGASAALTAIDNALNSVNNSRGTLGAVQNRFTSTISSLQTTSENLTAARSRIQDTDFAAESAELSRTQILQQAGTAMLAQANQSSQGVMALLR
ncbi:MULTISPECIES: flagellin N-terminal helical domain-containing protein [Methylobacter]